MNIVIIGAGDIGLHLASILSQFEYGIILIDKNRERLEIAARDLDVVTKLGSGTDWELLQETLEIEPDLFVALTDDDETNLVACSIAKNLGFPQTIARVRSSKYFLQQRLPFERLFFVDHLIGPEKLTANAIADMILLPGAVNAESFAHGSIEMRTIKIPSTWRKGHIPIRQKEELALPDSLMVALIRRESGDILFPHGNDALHPNDEVTFIGEPKALLQLTDFFQIEALMPKNVAIVGGSLVGIHLASLLEKQGIALTFIDCHLEKCKKLSELFPAANIIQRNGTDYHFLDMERIATSDVFVAATRSDETNFLAAASAKKLNCPKVIVSLADTHYLPLLEDQEIWAAASPRLVAANRILSIAREEKVASMVSLYDNRAEVLEVKVGIDSKIAGIPIRYLGQELPRDFLIAAIMSRGRVFIADGSRVISPGDTVIIISNPKHMKEIKRLF